MSNPTGDALNNSRGRPLKFKTPEELNEKAQAYFNEREIDGKPITISGLAYALDTTRELLCNYGERDQFHDTIRKIKQRCEIYAEEKLYTGPATGPIFALKNYGWQDKTTQELTGANGGPIVTESHPQDVEILQRLYKSNPEIFKGAPHDEQS